jgi:hypothetical protein
VELWNLGIHVSNVRYSARKFSSFTLELNTCLHGYPANFPLYYLQANFNISFPNFFFFFNLFPYLFPESFHPN